MSVVCIGGASIDRKYLAPAELQYGTSNPVRARRNFGGVARNVAENLTRLGIAVSLMSIVGNDENGVALLEHAERCGMNTHLVVRDSNQVTPEYAALVNPAGELLLGLADMSAIDSISVADVEQRWAQIARAQWLFIDCNLPADVLAWCIANAQRGGVRLAVDAVSEPKVCKLPDSLEGVDLFVLNEREAAVYLYEAYEQFEARPETARIEMLRERGAGAVVMTMGERGVLAGDGHEVQHIRAVATHTVDTTGGSDALCAGVLYSLVRGGSLFDGVRMGSLAAALTVESPATVRPDLSLSLLDLHVKRLEEAWTVL